MRKTLPTVTVAVSALNEANNIQPFLRSVLKQKEAGFILEKILVISDGSTDETVHKVRTISDKRIVVIDSSKRLGKSQRLNQIFKLCKSDILVEFDADVILDHARVIQYVIKPLIQKESFDMSAGDVVPFPGKTFVEKAIRCSFLAYYPLRKKLHGGNNIFSIDGKFIAYKKNFAKKIVIPPSTIGDDVYAYFFARTRGYRYCYVQTAGIHFRLPDNLRDHIKQSVRFAATTARMYQYFPREVVDREDSVPLKFFLYYTCKQFLQHPILATYIYCVNSYCRWLANRKEQTLTSRWEVAESTKR